MLRFTLMGLLACLFFFKKLWLDNYIFLLILNEFFLILPLLIVHVK